jgi:hypothetical protein
MPRKINTASLKATIATQAEDYVPHESHGSDNRFRTAAWHGALEEPATFRIQCANSIVNLTHDLLAVTVSIFTCGYYSS